MLAILYSSFKLGEIGNQLSKMVLSLVLGILLPGLKPQVYYPLCITLDTLLNLSMLRFISLLNLYTIVYTLTHGIVRIK